MIVCNKFVFLHLHKSGGTFVNQLIMSCIPYARTIGYHLPYTELPKSYARLPVLGTVRNPWAYYVSWYHFQTQLEQPNRLFMLASKNKTLNFEQTIFNLLRLNEDESSFNLLKNALPINYEAQGLNLTQKCITPLLGSDLGFYSFLYQRLYAQSESPVIMMMEQLRAELGLQLSRLKAEPKSKIQNFLQSAPNLNTSKHQSYQDYYSTALQQYIGKHDSLVIENHGYLF